MMYVDPDGEWALIDDVVACVIGGLVNSVIPLIMGDVKSFGHFGSLFLAGAIAGELTLYTVGGGAVFLGVSNSVINQGYTNGWDNINLNRVLFDGMLSMATAGIGSKVNGATQSAMNQVTGNIASPVIRESINRGVSGAASGFVVGTGVGLIQGESFDDALHGGVKNAALGGTLGIMSGIGIGLQQADQQGLNPWSGVAKTQSNNTLNDVRQNSPGWNYGDHKSQTKWENQMSQRGWTEQQINEALSGGKAYPATNNINPNNGATRYIHPATGRSVVIDNTSGRILHVGGDGFVY